ncbi:MAG: hypothetical protein KA313_08190 [Pseudarcicella sp.]|nr:hypothetical protein [Pseudarcicella sp.]MBP6411061.1 hypothetical protein [Pseudarcicella sp.]
MKKAIITILFATVFFTCKDDNDEFLDDIAGKWTIDKITFKNLPNSSPDSSIACKIVS